MKTLFIGFLLAVLLYFFRMAYQQSTALPKAKEALAQGHPEIALALLVHDDKEPFQFVSASNRESLCHQAWNQQARKLADSGRFDEAIGFTSQSTPCEAIAPQLVEAVRAETTQPSEILQRRLSDGSMNSST